MVSNCSYPACAEPRHGPTVILSLTALALLPGVRRLCLSSPCGFTPHPRLILRAGRGRNLLAGATIVLPLLAGVTFAWLNLQPWHIATAQVESINNELLRMVPPENRPGAWSGMYKNLPDNYAGAYTFH